MINIKDFVNSKDLIKFQIDSFNWLVAKGLQEVIDEREPLEIEIPNYTLDFGKIRVGTPVVNESGQGPESRYPFECRLRNLTYSAPILLEFIENGTAVEVEIGHLPVMLTSDICLLSKMNEEDLIMHGEDPADLGGYFIINGTERSLIIVEDLSPNKIITTSDEVAGKDVIISKVFSVRQGFRSRVTVERRDGGTSGTLFVSFPGIPNRIPLTILLKALGMSNEEIMGFFDDDEAKLEVELNLELKDMTSEEAFDYVGKRAGAGHAKQYQGTRANQVINNFLLPHIGNTDNERHAKAVYLGIMARKALDLYLAKRESDDKDHYSNKRLRLAGDLMQELFRVSFNKIARDIKYQLEKQNARHRQVNIKTAVRSNNLTESICYALATGNWTGGRAGVSQVLDRTNYTSSVAHRRRVSSLLSRSHPHFEARDLHATQWGRLCPSETPEGQNCGLVKNLSVASTISNDQDESQIDRYLADYGISDAKGSDIYLNGRLVGKKNKAEALVQKLRNLRREGKISPEISISLRDENNEVKIYTDRGRVLRPLIVVENGKSLLTDDHVKDLREGKTSWSELISKGIIEYLDAEEEENTYIAVGPEKLNKENTHLEVSCSLILGISASFAPYPEYNSAPRVTMASAMAKQSLGLYASNYYTRFDSRANVLHYPQVPLVKTDITDVLKLQKRAAGQNFVVAIMCYEGYNMEDAVILNKSSVQRGLGRSTFYRTYTTEERGYPSGQHDIFEIPGENVEGNQSPETYKKLDADGIIFPDTEVDTDDVLVGKTSPPRFLEEIGPYGMVEERRRENSTTVRHMESGTVDRVVLTETLEKNKLVKVRVRSQRIPELGDKFASRHGQKGVVGMLVAQEDMPFTKDGVVPDLVINPHAIPSRMTVGHLLEMLGGKVGCMAGKFINGTGFENDKEDYLRKELTKQGFKNTGKEVFYNGTTGKRFDAEIFSGVIYYQKLHHMVVNKIHARSRGPVQMLTRQPTEGRAREGGLRFGEMERDCLIAHGACTMLKDRLLDESDKVVVPICTKCGLVAVKDIEKDGIYCPICGESPTTNVEMAYAFKLLLNELMGMCIYPKLMLGEKA